MVGYNVNNCQTIPLPDCDEKTSLLIKMTMGKLDFLNNDPKIRKTLSPKILNQQIADTYTELLKLCS